MKYRRLTMRRLVDVLREHDVDLSVIKAIVDIGSMDGGDAVELQRLFPASQVYAIEGLRENYEKYLHHHPALRTFYAVIADHDGEVQFFEKDAQGVHSMYERVQLPTRTTWTVPCSRFDTFLREHNLPTPDLVKIDVEGATYDVLVGFGEVLKVVKVLQVETETKEWFQGQKLQGEVFRLLEENGFELVFLQRCCEGQYDSVFVHTSFLSSSGESHCGSRGG